MSDASSRFRQKECGFCHVLAGEAEGSFVFRDERVAAFMDITPVTPGHMLVIPIRHAVYLSDLDQKDGARMFVVAQSLAAALRSGETGGPSCEGVNLYLADGEAGGQEVPHVHLHVFPRYTGDGFDPRLPDGYGHHPKRSELDRIAAAIRAGLSQQRRF